MVRISVSAKENFKHKLQANKKKCFKCFEMSSGINIWPGHTVQPENGKIIQTGVDPLGSL